MSGDGLWTHAACGETVYWTEDGAECVQCGEYDMTFEDLTPPEGQRLPEPQMDGQGALVELSEVATPEYLAQRADHIKAEEALGREAGQ